MSCFATIHLFVCQCRECTTDAPMFNNKY